MGKITYKPTRNIVDEVGEINVAADTSAATAATIRAEEDVAAMREAEEVADDADAADAEAEDTEDVESSVGDSYMRGYMSGLDEKADIMYSDFRSGVDTNGNDLGEHQSPQTRELPTKLDAILVQLSVIDAAQYSLEDTIRGQRDEHFNTMDYLDDVDHIIHKFRGRDQSLPSGWGQDKLLLDRLHNYIISHYLIPQPPTVVSEDAKALFRRINISIRAEDGNIEAPEQEETEPEVPQSSASIGETLNLGSEFSIAPQLDDEDQVGTILQENIYDLEDQMSNEHNRSGNIYDFILQNMTEDEKQNDNIDLLVELLSRNKSDFDLVLSVIQAKLALEEHEGNVRGQEVMGRFLQIATTARARFAEEKAAKKTAERAAATSEITIGAGKKYKSKKKAKKNTKKAKKNTKKAKKAKKNTKKAKKAKKNTKKSKKRKN